MHYLKLVGILLVCILQSCSSQSSIEKKVADFKILKKISLEVDSLYPNTSTGHYGIVNNQFGSFDMVAPNLKMLLRFDSSGKLIDFLGKENLRNNFKIPDIVFPVGFEIVGDTTLLFYPNGKVYFAYQKNIVGQIDLQIPKNHIVTRGTSFFYNPQKQTFLVSIGIDSEKAEDFFSKSKPFSLFDARSGSLIKQFGEYPSEYKKGFFIHGGMTFIEKLRENNYFYCLYPHLSNLYKYDLEGTLIETIKLPESSLRDTSIRFTEVAWEKIPSSQAYRYFNDTYRGGIAKVKGKNIFYYSFYSHAKRKEIICRYDADQKLFTETIANTNSFIRLFPFANNNSCYFLATNPQSDEVYIYEIFMD
jgi:hypothetical protein